jgi:hypothetical protein
VAGLKSSWCKPGIKIVGYVCTEKGRFPGAKKVEKIVLWPACMLVKEVRAVLGVGTYYRIVIKDFALLAAPLFHLLRKRMEFDWGKDQATAMDVIKQVLSTVPTLAIPRYGLTAGLLILAMDAGGEQWGVVLM